MMKITLETESYLITGKPNQRFLPFFELEYNEWVIFEDDKPKYYFELHHDTESSHSIINSIVTDLKNGKNLRELIVEIGKQNSKNWDIFHSQIGREVEDSFQTEKIELEFLSDETIENIKNNNL